MEESWKFLSRNRVERQNCMNCMNPVKFQETTEGRQSTKSVAFNSGMESDRVGSSSAENKNELSIGG